MAAENVIDDSHCNNDGSDCALEANDVHVQGQVVHRFVNNFHIHQGGNSVKCGNCAAEKTCPHCNAAVGKHQCEVCGIWMSSNHSHIEEHMRVHSGERPHLCERCGMAFKKSSHLSEHHRIHTGTRPFVCNVCGESFRQQGHLDAHHRSAHSDERGFECKQCSKEFKLRKSLMRHLREVHKCVYDCDECGDKLRTRNEYTNHAVKHFKEKAARGSDEGNEEADEEDARKEATAAGYGVIPVTYDSQLAQ